MNTVAMLTACMQHQDREIPTEYYSETTRCTPDATPPGANVEGVLPVADQGIEGARELTAEESAPV